MAYTAIATATFNRDTVVYGDLRIGNNPVTPNFVYRYDIFISFSYSSSSSITAKNLKQATSAISFSVYSYHDNGYTVDTATTVALADIKTILAKALYYYDNQSGSLILPASGGYKYWYNSGSTSTVLALQRQYITCKATYVEFDGQDIIIHGSGVEDATRKGTTTVAVLPQTSLTITDAMLTNAGTYSYNYSNVRKAKLTLS